MPYVASLVEAGLHNLRYTDPRYSLRAIADYAKKRSDRDTAR